MGLQDGPPARKLPLGWIAALLLVAVVSGGASGLVVSQLDNDDSSSTPSVSAPSTRPPDPAAAAAADKTGIAETAAYAFPSVVTIINEGDPHDDGMGNQVVTTSVGSGFIADDHGFIVTNEHVIHTPGKLTVVLNDGSERPATIVSTDAPFTDLAVLRIPSGGLQSLPFGDSDALVPGQTVVAIGSALFEYHNSVSAGIVSGLKRQWTREGVIMEDLVQTDAAINNGNSGGPLLNLKGEVIGITTNVVRRLGNADNVYGISFAISSKTMQPIVQSIIQKGEYPRPYFGIDHQNVDEEYLTNNPTFPVDHGALVQRVVSGSPAANAGIRPGDVLLALGDNPIDDSLPFINALSRAGVNDRVPVQLWRNGVTQTVTVGLTPR